MYVRLILAFIISLILVLIGMPKLIDYLKKISFNQTVSEYSLKEYKEKAKTPTMGGILFIVVPIIVTLFLAKGVLADLKMIVILLSFAGYGLIGFIDDYIIVIKRDNEGLRPKQKFIMQLLLAIIFFIIYRNNVSLDITIPIIKVVLPLSWLYSILVFFMFTGASNAVNLTDGMDGLAAGCSFISYIAFLIIALCMKEYQVAIFISSLLGALLGYLHYNVSPAKIFMGDTGSLALGAGFAAIAMVLKQELLLIIIGGVFVWETLCVIIQISSVKIRKKRVFKYTPIHYSFVLDGISEKRVVRSFWLLSLICAVIGLVVYFI
ncbi:MAG: phospho-N-acetylmuramoyl-pentapeptide-transferase [Firmicutes bacterium]|nr:phospho-N-acetylmuramoyl-pentapeptide-transferase [Erysipelotrichaceae bacterium]MDD6525935.1 phospho-N-acetylmuramoyl-pentapeptide-transferase [Bacillota bacterium]MDD7227417.1 phospho-N-acetylmuramoyl-pentapeptide-transferase [Bacillota bacterium]MDY4972868.1 phospho-N-acetylmuramoyl-pentapeptide-transferase [Erysipelotrichaceae bacterium]MDY5997958.1 phospho-N-acetylmuramoyl-pentapeptide-transferase [Erysipelotrichaceae bacterium]